MILLRGISKSFGRNEVLKDISMDLPSGEILGIVGPSGGGKSVLLKILGGVIKQDSGSIRYPAEQDELRVGFLFQEGALFDSLSVLENVCFPLENGISADPSISYSEKRERSFEMLSAVGLEAAYLKMPGQLSGGMRRRVAIARALVHRPNLVLLDDPTGGLDPVAASVIMDLITSLHSQYQPTMLIVSHDLRRLFPNSTRIFGLFDGRIACNEAPKQLSEKVSPEILRFMQTRFDFSSLVQK